MIVSHRHRFIYLRTRKTAGTSIEMFLRQFCGPDDIVTRDFPIDERIALTLGLPGPQHYCAGPLRPWTMTRRDLRWMRRHRAWPRRALVHPHSPAATIRRMVGEDIWAGYTKITSVRDPWEFVVSHYHFRRRRLSARQLRNGDPPGLTLDDAVERAGWNWATYTIDGVPVFDRAIRYEHLQRDLMAVTDALGLEPRVDLGAMKSTHRPPATAAVDVLEASQARRVAELAAGEIALFGYRWSGAEPI